MGYQCNVQCDYCTITPTMRERNLTTAQIARALEQGAQAGLTEAAFGGGEPTIRADLARLVRLARSLGYRRVKVSSNGLRFAYADYVQRLIDCGVDQFNVPLMGWHRQAYARIMGREEHFDLVQRGVGHLVARGALVVGDLIMKRDTYGELSRTVDFWAELGIERFVLWLVSLTDRTAEDPTQLVPVSTMRPHIFEAFEAGRRLGIPVLSRHLPRCLLPGYHDHVWDVRSDRVLVVTPESTFWLSESRITANAFVAQCDSCGVRKSCMGLRRDYLDHVGSGEVRALP